MGYVAIKGGERAIRAAAQWLEFLRARGGGEPLAVATIRDQLHVLTDRVMSEGGLYDPDLAALAIKQAAGDTLEAAFYLRAYRSTQARLLTTAPHDTRQMRLIRRISAAFKEIPGGQMLGPTSDYLQRLFRFELLQEDREAFRAIAREWLAERPDVEALDDCPKVIEALRAEGLLAPVADDPEPAFDITREALVFPVPRSAALATMSRAETGSLLALAYSNMRGYGDIHPTVAELRVGYVPLYLPHPLTGETIEAGEVLITECEVVAMFSRQESPEARPVFTLGYGACFGHHEVKAIAMAILDRALQKGRESPPGGRPEHPSEDAEFVLLHIDGVDSMGFCTHYKMPHYVTFQSDLDRLRRAQAQHDGAATSSSAREAP